MKRPRTRELVAAMVRAAERSGMNLVMEGRPTVFVKDNGGQLIMGGTWVSEFSQSIGSGMVDLFGRYVVEHARPNMSIDAKLRGHNVTDREFKLGRKIANKAIEAFRKREKKKGAKRVDGRKRPPRS